MSLDSQGARDRRQVESPKGRDISDSGVPAAGPGNENRPGAPDIRCEAGGGQARSPGVSCQLSLDTVTHCAATADRAGCNCKQRSPGDTHLWSSDGFETIPQYFLFL